MRRLSSYLPHTSYRAKIHIEIKYEINKKAINMDISTYNKEGAEIEALAKEEWSKAVPLLETALSVDEQDELALQNLQAVYSKLRDVEKAQMYYDLRKKFGYISEEG
jgi:hypothetical protein